MQYIPDPNATAAPGAMDQSVEITAVKSGGLALPAAVVLVLVVLGLGAWKMAGSGSRWHHDLHEGMAEAAQAHRPALVLFTADWCPPCKMLKKEILPQPEVADYLASDYVCIKIDLTERGGPNAALAQQWSINAIPTMVIMDPGGVEIDSYTGPMPPAELRGWLERCRARVN